MADGIEVDGNRLSPAQVVGWLRNAEAAHRDESSPARRLVPALNAAEPGDREAALVHLGEALREADDSFRTHLMWSLQGFDTGDLRRIYADLLDRPPPWLSTRSGAEAFIQLVGHGPSADPVLAGGVRTLFEQHDMADRALQHFVTFHASTVGFELLVEHLEGGGPLDPGIAGRFGGRFARDAPQRLPALGRLLASRSGEVRQAFFEGAAWRLDATLRRELREALGLDA